MQMIDIYLLADTYSTSCLTQFSGRGKHAYICQGYTKNNETLRVGGILTGVFCYCSFIY